MHSSDVSVPRAASTHAPFLKILGCAVLGLAELGLARSLLASLDVASGALMTAAFVAAKGICIASIVFVLVVWPRRTEFFDVPRGSPDGGSAKLFGIGNALALAAVLLLDSPVAGLTPEIGRALAIGCTLILIGTLTALLASVFPRPVWRFPKNWRSEIVIATAVAAVIVTFEWLPKRSWAYFMSEDVWTALINATLYLSYWILSLFQEHAVIDPSARILGVGNFKVQISGPCSGYEGMAIIAMFLAGYLWIFRRSLRFPNAILLFPVAMGVIWLLNAMRIALLIAIGANISPEIALGGFHSQFGWICILAVAMAILLLVPKVAFISKSSRAPRSTPVVQSGTDDAFLFLAPFIAMTAANIVIGAFAPHEQSVYPIKVFMVAAAIAIGWRAYASRWEKPSLLSVSVGAIIGVLWIATDPLKTSPLGDWIAGLALWQFVMWMTARALGSIILVPIAEELAFRGCLYRMIISPRFENVAFSTFSWLALIVSSAAFAMLHERWLAAFFAGLIYALLMLRRGRLSDAIAAHMASNAVIIAWAVAAQQWSLL
jgi:exosortase E/protease (VPEID-CTERM system)